MAKKLKSFEKLKELVTEKPLTEEELNDQADKEIIDSVFETDIQDEDTNNYDVEDSDLEWW